MMRDIFSVGANLVAVRAKNPETVDAGIFTGAVFSGVFFGLVVINVDKFISFMNADSQIYRDFCLYISLQLWIQLVFCLILDKLYYQDKNKLANKYSSLFNLLIFVVLIGASLIIKNPKIIIVTTLASILIFMIFIFIKEVRRISFRFNIFRAIKINSMDFGENIVLFFVYLIGVERAFFW